MEDKLKLYMEKHIRSFVGGMVNTMTAELPNQISHLAKAHASSDRKIDRIGASMSELNERIRASEARHQERQG